MQRRSFISSGCLIALLSIGSAMIPSLAAAHTEGVEAADPATPAALLGFRSAADRYDARSSGRKAWREIFTGERASEPMMMDDHAGASEHAGHMMHSDSATMQQ
jgi:hypothetical protein